MKCLLHCAVLFSTVNVSWLQVTHFTQPKIVFGGFKPIVKNAQIHRRPKSFRIPARPKIRERAYDLPPTFPLSIPKKYMFGPDDAVVKYQKFKPLKVDNQNAQQRISPNIFNFLTNSIQPLPFFNLHPKQPIQPHKQRHPTRPREPPPNQPISITPKPIETFVPHIPQSNANEGILQPTKPPRNDAFTIFNSGLDNFITNDPTSFPGLVPLTESEALTISSRPQLGSLVSNNKLPIIPPGLSVEEKTKLLAELDPNQQFILSAPNINAGVLPLKLRSDQPMILFPPLDKPLRNKRKTVLTKMNQKTSDMEMYNNINDSL